MFQIMDRNWSFYPFVIFTTILILSFHTGLTFLAMTSQVLAQTSGLEGSNSLTTFNNSLYGITMKYPSDWGKIEGGFLPRFEVKNMIPVVDFSAPDCSVSVFLG